MDFRTLVQKQLRCVYVPMSPQEEREVTTIIRNKEGINRILGKPVSADASPAFRYYIGLCHIRRKHDEGYDLLLSAGDAGCGAAWWELSLLSDHGNTQISCRAKAYSFGCPEAVAYVGKDLEGFSGELISLIYAGNDRGCCYLKALLTMARQPNMSYLVEIVGSHSFSSKVDIKEADLEDIRTLLNTLLPHSDPDRKDYSYNLDAYNRICDLYCLE